MNKDPQTPTSPTNPAPATEPTPAPEPVPAAPVAPATPAPTAAEPAPVPTPAPAEPVPLAANAIHATPSTSTQTEVKPTAEVTPTAAEPAPAPADAAPVQAPAAEAVPAEESAPVEFDQAAMDPVNDFVDPNPGAPIENPVEAPNESPVDAPTPAEDSEPFNPEPTAASEPTISDRLAGFTTDSAESENSDSNPAADQAPDLASTDPLVAASAYGVDATAASDPNLDSALNSVSVEPSTAGSIVEPAKKKGKFGAILALVFALLLIAGLVGGAIFILNSQKSNPVVKNNPDNAPEVIDEVGLVCTYEPDATTLSNYANLKSYNLKMIANYFKDSLVDISVTGVYNYTTAEAATLAGQRSRAQYMADLSTAGIAADPFSSAYPVSGTLLTVIHLAEYKDLNSTNALAVFKIDSDENGNLIDDIDSIEAKYKKGGYTCTHTDGGVSNTLPDETEADTNTNTNTNQQTQPQADQQTQQQTDSQTQSTTQTEQAQPQTDQQTQQPTETPAATDNSQTAPVQLPE